MKSASSVSLGQSISFGKYDLLERINVGGMAEVFRAKAYGVEGFERLVAVKRILPNIAEDQEFIRMFIDEAKIAVQLNHANIAQIFDLGVVDGSYYIALEHIHGRDLRAIYDRCRNRRQPIPLAQACFMVMKLCEGLDYAHNKRDQSGSMLGLVHRDVSPQNILVSFEGEVKIIDFGIAKAAGQGPATQAGILKGKFGYMSPEQVRGLPIDRRSDIFSCGIVLYELLTGQRLFIGESDFATLEKVRNVEITMPSDVNPNIPDELERIILKSLSPDVEERYQNAIDLHDELQAFVYTSGEFCSRKDLAGWMKRLFSREIEAETAKLESFEKMSARKRGEAPAGSTRKDRPATLVPDADLDWDDDELETSIYDDPPATRVEEIQVLDDIEEVDESWPKTKKDVIPVPSGVAAAVPLAAESVPSQATPEEDPPLFVEPPNTQESSAVSAIIAGASARDEIFDPMRIPAEPTQTIAAQRPPKQKKSVLPYIIVTAACALLVAGVGYWFLTKGDDKKTTSAPSAENVASSASAMVSSAVATGASGFKLWVSPQPKEVKLNGEVQDWPLTPSAPGQPGGVLVENLDPGTYTIEFTAPEGFKNHSETVEVAAGKMPEVNVTLAPELVRVLFSSTPSGANVTLIADGERTDLGPTPTAAKLDPNKQYDMIFHQKGRVTVTKPLVFNNQASQTVSETLAVATGIDNISPPRSSRSRAPASSRSSLSSIAINSSSSSTARKRVGLVTFAVRPSCAVYVDGKFIGRTPTKAKVELGSHSVRLVNKQFKIRKTYRYNVRPGASVFKKDLSSLVK